MTSSLFVTDPRMDTVILTRGGQFTKQILADPGTTWPPGTSYMNFYATNGDVITQLSGIVGDQVIEYSNPPADTDMVPAGAAFDIFLDTADGPYKIRYGKVIRKEVTFWPLNVAGVGSNFGFDESGGSGTPGGGGTGGGTGGPPPIPKLTFSDTFYTSSGTLSTRWIPVTGQTSIHDNTAIGQQNGVGVTYESLYQKSSIRWYASLNTDIVSCGVTLVHTGGKGKSMVMVSADQNFGSYAGMVLDTSVPTSDQIAIVTGTAPDPGVTGSDPGATTWHASANHSISNYDEYCLKIDGTTGIVSMFSGLAPTGTPLLTWTDSTHIIPHGLGYRHLGLAFAADLATGGPQFTTWTASDV